MQDSKTFELNAKVKNAWFDIKNKKLKVVGSLSLRHSVSHCILPQSLGLVIASQVVERKAWRKAGILPVKKFIEKVKADRKGMHFIPGHD